MPIINGTPGNDGIVGSPGNDTINGLAGDDQLTGDPNLPIGGDDLLDGGDGHDFLRGRAGNDTLLGGNGDDFLEGGPGNDSIDGGAGFDRLAFTSAPNGVSVDLSLQGTPQNTGAGTDVFTGIEHVSGTFFADTLIGDAGDNWIWGEGGNDSLSGGDGNDLVQVNQGSNQTADGGAGIDTLSFDDNGAPPTDGVHVSLALQGAAQDTGRGSMTLTGFENLSGTQLADTLTGDSGANLLAGDIGNDSLSGGAGDDTLLGDGSVRVDTHGTGGSGPITTYADFAALAGAPGGADTLDGGAGNDTLQGGAGNDVLIGGDGSNRLDGGDGFDTADYSTATSAVSVSMTSGGNGFATTATSTDTLVGIERVVGSAFDDFLQGGSGNDVLEGGDGHDNLRGRDGADTLLGGNGDDFLTGGNGDDLIDGGAGIDRAGFAFAATAGVTVDLNLQGVAQNTGQGMDTLVNIEHVSGTSFADTLIGDAGDNWIWGQGGNDSLSGGGGNDLVQLGWTPSNDTVDGGAGVDTLSFDGNGSDTTGVQASLALQGAAQDTLRGMVTATGFENLSGSQFADTLAGDANDNLLAGAAGDDSLSGGAGNDVLYGDGQVVVDTHGTGTSGPIVTDPDVTITNAVAGGNDTLDGGAGDDTLHGGQGDDLLTGGSGNNLIDGGAGVDTATYATASGPISLFGNHVDHGDGTDTLTGVERVIGSAFDDQMVGGPGNDDLEGGGGHDVLRGRAGDDTLIGGAGDDFLVPGQGNDSVDGGAGFDRVGFFQDATAGVHVDLNLQGTAQDTGMGIKTLVGIEHVSGTNFADTLIGDGGDNWIWGQGGGDSLSGGAGADLVQLGWTSSNDTADGGAGVDTLSFDGNGSDTTGVLASLALQGAAQDTLRGIVTATGFENLSGSQFADTLAGDAGDNLLAGAGGNDSLSGGAGNDVLYGDGQVGVDTHGTGGSGPIVTLADASSFNAVAPGNDTLDGGTGDDTLIGGAGADVLTGGKGADHFVFLSINDSTPTARDLITDLENKDVIDLSAIDADVNTAGDQAFHLVNAFTHHAGEAVLEYDKALKVTHLSLDVNGDGIADSVIDIAGQAKNFSGFIF